MGGEVEYAISAMVISFIVALAFIAFIFALLHRVVRSYFPPEPVESLDDGDEVPQLIELASFPKIEHKESFDPEIDSKQETDTTSQAQQQKYSEFNDEEK